MHPHHTELFIIIITLFYFDENYSYKNKIYKKLGAATKSWIKIRHGCTKSSSTTPNIANKK